MDIEVELSFEVMRAELSKTKGVLVPAKIWGFGNVLGFVPCHDGREPDLP